MATFNFSTKKKVNNTVQPNNSVVLTKHNAVERSQEYYSYIVNGNECKYTGALLKKGDSYVGKLTNVHKVVLTYHEAVAHVDAKDSYFSYLDEGKECVFEGTPIFNEDTQTYSGVLPVITLKDTVIDIFPVEE